MASSVAALHFRRRNDESILQACFDALKHHKEVEKY